MFWLKESSTFREIVLYCATWSHTQVYSNSISFAHSSKEKIVNFNLNSQRFIITTFRIILSLNEMIDSLNL